MTEDSNYHSVYADEINERQEIKRVRRRIAHWSCMNCDLLITDDELTDAFDKGLICPRCKGDLYVHEPGGDHG